MLFEDLQILRAFLAVGLESVVALLDGHILRIALAETILDLFQVPRCLIHDALGVRGLLRHLLDSHQTDQLFPDVQGSLLVPCKRTPEIKKGALDRAPCLLGLASGLDSRFRAPTLPLRFNGMTLASCHAGQISTGPGS